MTQPFQFANGQLAHSAEDLLKLCQQFPADGINYLIREDLEKWLSYIGQEDIAQCAANARQTPLEDRQKLEEFLTKCHSLSFSKTETPVEASLSQTTPVAEETPVEASLSQTTPIAEETTVEADRPTVVETPSPTIESESSNSTEAKPSFFRAIARLILNVLYRNQN